MSDSFLRILEELGSAGHQSLVNNKTYERLKGLTNLPVLEADFEVMIYVLNKSMR